MNILILIILGLTTSLLFPPYFFYPLGFVVFPILCFIIDKNLKNVRKTKLFYNSFIYGFSFFCVLLFWIQNPFLAIEETKSLFYLATILILILTFIFSVIFTIIIFYNKFLPTVFILPIIFILTEFSFSLIFYGFPWINFSLIASNIKSFSIILGHFGTFITSYLILQIFCIPYIFFAKKLKVKYCIYYSLIVITPLISVFCFNVSSINKEIKNIDLDVEIYQLNKQIISDKKSKYYLDTIIDQISQSSANLILYAENNYPFLIDNLDVSNIQKIIKKNQTVIIGASRFENKQYFNSFINITKSKVQSFDKKILVPFGEFLPFRKYLSFLDPISGNNDYSTGSKDRFIKINDNLNYIPVICYEIIFYWKLVNQTNASSDLIINITNDIWFGNLLGPYQHFYLTKLRASEFNKPIIRVSNNGISSIINKDGIILEATQLNKEQYLRKNINFKIGNNNYLMHKLLNTYSYFIFLIIILINIIKIYERYKSKL